MKNLVCVAGAGTMGNGIAHVFAQSGWRALIVDQSDAALSKALATINANMDRQVKKGALTEDAKAEAIARVTTSTSLDCASEACLLVEAIFEDEAAKKALFARADEVVNADAVFASNTSSISITRLASATKRPDRFIGMHFMNPVPVMKLVEVIRGHATSDATCARVMEISRELGKDPVEVNDYPGFVSNRVLMPMINEAAFCLMEGVATREAIDTVMKLGMAHPMGPLQLADFIGLDVCVNILHVLHEGLGDPKYRACPLLRKMVAAGHLGKKSGRGFYDYA
ncbi:MAG: 3-hydroxybutyryl-CoA dehydrogenase [Candidatus Sumerlaeia bacterium]|nr:3-hydroxybutyryl-CoA dehydrogenase [Candidatus Sumerlaeia bacterium]